MIDNLRFRVIAQCLNSTDDLRFRSYSIKPETLANTSVTIRIVYTNS
jgi:DNA-directed RNA polymerase subunit L